MHQKATEFDLVGTFHQTIRFRVSLSREGIGSTKFVRLSPQATETDAACYRLSITIVWKAYFHVRRGRKSSTNSESLKRFEGYRRAHELE